jgi:ornithine cyclodeaminase/alanine dehydrogenase-like protein (mu-crystallin family)
MNILCGSECPGLLTIREAVELSKTAFSMLSLPGASEVPERQIIELSAGRFTIMPGATRNEQDVGAKLLTVFPGNLQRGLARINALVVILDPATGLVDTILDGTWLTAFRTGAACGASVDLLARKKSKVVAVFGAGPVAYMSLVATASVRKIEEIRICCRDPSHAERLIQKVALELSLRLNEQVLCMTDPFAALAGAEIVITATNAPEAIVPDSAISAGVHIAAMGGGYPNYELEPETLHRASIYVDSRESAARESGDIRRAWGKMAGIELPVAGELGEVVLGKLTGREDDEEITLFESCGSAVQDVLLGSELARRARARKLGVQIDAFHARKLI